VPIFVSQKSLIVTAMVTKRAKEVILALLILYFLLNMMLEKAGEMEVLPHIIWRHQAL
jgi:hypothetical protein